MKMVDFKPGDFSERQCYSVNKTPVYSKECPNRIIS